MQLLTNELMKEILTQNFSLLKIKPNNPLTIPTCFQGNVEIEALLVL